MKRQYQLLCILKKYKLRSFYSQLILMVMMLTTVLTVVSVSVLFFLRSNMIEREKETQKAILENVVEQLDGVLRNTYQAINSLVESQYLIKGLSDYNRDIESYTDDERVKDIISRLYLVNHLDENIKNVFVIQAKYDYVVDQKGVTGKELYFRNHFGDETGLWEELVKERHKYTMRMKEDGSSLYVLHSMYSENEKFATLCVEVDLQRLNSRETFREFVEGRIVCVTDQNWDIIGYLSKGRDDGRIREAVGKGSVKGYLFLSGGTVEGLNILALTPLDMVTGEISIFFTVSLVVFAVSVFFGITAAVSIGGRIYRPLYHAVELIEVAGNRGGDDEFEVIEQNVSAILEHDRNMASFVTRSTPIVLEAIFRRLIMEVSSDKDFDELLDMLEIEVRDGYYMVAVIYANLEKELEEWIDVLFAENVVSMFKRHKNEYVMILYLVEEASRNTVLEQCDKLLEHVDALAAAGRAYKNLNCIGKSYNDALRILESRRADQSEARVFDAASDYRYIGYELPGNVESLLYDQIVAGNGSVVLETIEESLRKNLERGISFREYQQLVGTFESYLTRMRENMEGAGWGGMGLEEFSGTALSMRDMEQRVEIMLKNYGRVTEFYDDKVHVEGIDRILSYIEENLDRDIGLHDVASAVKLTPNYITKYFKDKKGINFKSYLTMKRMEKARELLTGTELSVKEIASKCGYNSSKQFIVNFTKITGITPTEYRKSQVLA